MFNSIFRFQRKLLIPNKKELIIFLQGGIGNQFFQYFFGVYIKRKYNLEVVLDSSLLESTNVSHPNSGIKKLNLKLRLNSKYRYYFRILKLQTFLYNLFSNLAEKNIIKLLPDLYIAKSIGYDPKTEQEITGNKTPYLLGYFQSWRYFDLNMNEKNNLFSKLIYQDPWIIENIEKMTSQKFIAVHIRLGDYVLKKNAFIGVLPKGYYSNALAYLTSKRIHQPFYIFSDDILNAKKIFGSMFPHDSSWVDVAPHCDPMEVFAIMRMASTFIIANSTYSWWAAMLSTNSPLVLAPKKWFKDQEDPIDLLPNNWILIEPDWTKNT
jgi:Glycosyl transferase family 11